MSTSFPGGLDSFTNPSSGQFLNSPSHSQQHDNINDAMAAVQAKLGINGSAVNTSHDYKLSGVTTGDKAVSLTGSETLTNKTLTTPIIAAIKVNAGANTVTLPTSTDTLVGRATTDTLTNKTLSSPGLSGTAVDSNGSSLLAITATVSAVNYLGIKNNTTGNQPQLQAKGSDTDVSVDVIPQGAGQLRENGSVVSPVGAIIAYGGRTAPTGWLLCDGAGVSRTTYARLFNAIVPSVGAFTVTIASPGVVTLNSHGLQTGDSVYLTTSGALPTGLTANTIYYVVRIDANTFNLATSRANAYAATKINTSGTQSGTHTLLDCPWGLGDGSTTFNVPDLRGRTLAGNDSMNGTVASRLTLAQSQGVYGNRGSTGGEQGHQITTAELASHAHSITLSNSGVADFTAVKRVANDASGNLSTGSAGSDTAHNNVQPTGVANFIIKT